MSKPIEALRNKSGNIFWPATASDAVIHPKTKKTLTEHITRYNLTEYTDVMNLQGGIEKLTGTEPGQLGIIPKVGDIIIIATKYFGQTGKIREIKEYIYNQSIWGGDTPHLNISNWEEMQLEAMEKTNIPSSGSSLLITSGGVYTALQSKQDAIEIIDLT